MQYLIIIGPGAEGPQGPPGQGVLFGHLIVITHVTGNIHGATGGATASDFIIHVSGNHQSPDTSLGSETGTQDRQKKAVLSFQCSIIRGETNNLCHSMRQLALWHNIDKQSLIIKFDSILGPE